MNKAQRFFVCGSSWLLGLALIGPAAPNGFSKDQAKPASRPPVVPTVPEVPIPQSIFVVPTDSSEGRNPFFPQSVALPAPPPNKPSATEVITLVLNGITSPPRRTAIVNNRTFERGEEGEVHLPNGNKVLIRCEEIRADSAIISVGGVRRELKLRSGL